MEKSLYFITQTNVQERIMIIDMLPIEDDLILL